MTPLVTVLERLTCGQLARQVGVARSTVLRWTRGARPRGKNRERLRALGIECGAPSVTAPTGG